VVMETRKVGYDAVLTCLFCSGDSAHNRGSLLECENLEKGAKRARMVQKDVQVPRKFEAATLFFIIFN
jgi:hypothetical protein